MVAGLTVILLPVRLPGAQLYVLAPVAVNLMVALVHIAADAGTVVIANTGNALVFTCTVSGKPIHPKELVPVTVYVVLTAGFTVMLLPLRLTGAHVYVLAL